MASWYKNQGKTLVDGLNEIYDEYGYFLDYLDSFVLKGKDGAEKIQNLMTSFRNKGTSLFDGIEEVIDFSNRQSVICQKTIFSNIFGKTVCGWQFAHRVQSLKSRCITQ